MSRRAPETMPKWSRPIRIPVAIEITHADPPFAIAGDTSSWRIPFRLSKGVPPDAALRLQLYGGRNNKGKFADAQCENPHAEGYIAAELEDGTPVRIRPTEQPGTCAVGPPDGGLKKGDMLTVVLGDQTNGGGVRACRAHTFNKFFLLYSIPANEVDAKLWQGGHGQVWAPETWDWIIGACTMHILGGEIDHIRAYVPATTRPRRSFNVLVRPEDKYGNLSHQEIGAVALSVDGRPLEAEVENVPDSTCLRANISLSAEGICRVQVREVNSGLEAEANPTVCAESGQGVYWGMIHGHTEMSDGTGTLDQYFRQLKDEVMLNFGAAGDHDHLWETPGQFWETTCESVKRWHEPYEFVTFLGYEWAKWRRNGDGDRNVYYLKDDQPLYRSDDGEYPSPPDLFRILKANEAKAIVIPHHTGHAGNFCDWKDHSPEYERLVELFQQRGSYECSVEDGNPVPEKETGVAPFRGGYVRKALALGWRVGFTAGGDDHDGHWGTEFRFDIGYKQGLMSVEAPELTREAIFAAMYNRRVTATTGPRMLLTYQLNARPMGSELSLKTVPELASTRNLAVQFHGTAATDRIDIIRNNSVVHSVSGTGSKDLSVSWEDNDPIDNIWLPAARFCGNRQAKRTHLGRRIGT